MNARILLLASSDDLAAMMRLLLEQEGHRVEIALSGIEAVRRIARESFDLLLADLRIRDLSALGVAQAVRDLARIPVVVISALDPSDWQREALRSGASACLPQPFGIDDLLWVVRAVLAAKPNANPAPHLEVLTHEDLARIRTLTDEELDQLPFGIIRVDARGIITRFNAYEVNASGFAAPTVVGLPFEDVVPCARVRAFASELDEVERSPEKSRVLQFVFPRRRASCTVSVRIFYDPLDRQRWIFVSQRINSAH